MTINAVFVWLDMTQNRMEAEIVLSFTLRFHSVHFMEEKTIRYQEWRMKRLSDNWGVKRSTNGPYSEEFSVDMMVMKSTKGLSVVKPVGPSTVPGKYNSLFFLDSIIRRSVQHASRSHRTPHPSTALHGVTTEKVSLDRVANYATAEVNYFYVLQNHHTSTLNVYIRP
jgi:hypothetical protein